MRSRTLIVGYLGVVRTLEGRHFRVCKLSDPTMLLFVQLLPSRDPKPLRIFMPRRYLRRDWRKFLVTEDSYE